LVRTLAMAKLLAVGDGECGKTCLLDQLMERGEFFFDHEYEPTTFNNFIYEPVGKDGIQWELWDSSGIVKYEQLRPLSYPGTDVFLVMFDINQKASLENVQHKWVPELTAFRKKELFGEDTRIPWLVLVATKADLAEGTPESCTPARINKIARECGFCAYVECSAKDSTGIGELRDRLVALVEYQGSVLGRDQTPPGPDGEHLWWSGEASLGVSVARLEALLEVLQAQEKGSLDISLKIKTPSTTFQIDCSPDTTVARALGHACESNGELVDFDKRALCFGGSELPLECTLDECGIDTGVTLQLISANAGQAQLLIQLVEGRKAMEVALQADIGRVSSALSLISRGCVTNQG